MEKLNTVIGLNISKYFTWSLLLLLLPNVSAATGKWKEVKHDAEHDVVVYTRKLDSGDTEFKGITHVKSSLSGCIALLRDVDAMPEWVNRTVMAKVLHRVSDTEAYAYNITYLDFPFTNRDAIVHSVLVQDPKTLAITVKGKGIQTYNGKSQYDYKAHEHDYVRMAKVESFWRFVPQGNGIVEVTFQGYGNPGGHISSALFKWFIGLVVWEAPYKTLMNMHKMIGRSKYQNARLSYIKEPNDHGGRSSQ